MAYRVNQRADYSTRWSLIVLWQWECHLLGKEPGVSYKEQAYRCDVSQNQGICFF
jgi:hypothetical protein